MGTLLVYAVVAILSTALVWKGSDLLESSSAKLSIHYELPDIVTGAIIVAIGSSFPEFATVVLSTTLHGEFELGVSAIVGSALFNILIIPALASLVGEKNLESNRDLVYKEAQFYMLSVAILLLTFAFAAIYNPVSIGPRDISGRMTRGLALLPLAMYGLYLFVQWQDTIDFEPDVDVREIKVGRQWLLLLLSFGIILVGVEGLVRTAIEFGRVLETPSFLWGITVVAAATSIPDAFVSIKAARSGNAITSLANVLGSNIFDLLVCIPAGVLIAGTATVSFTVAAPMMGVLTLATLALFLFMRTDMTLVAWEAWFLLFFYLLFVVWIGLESFGVIDTVPSLPPTGKVLTPTGS